MAISNQLKVKYGITLEYKEQMYEKQGRKCKLCDKPFSNLSDAHVDHSHLTDQVRSLVHRDCNTLIGWIENNLELIPKVFAYLEKELT